MAELGGEDGRCERNLIVAEPFAKQACLRAAEREVPRYPKCLRAENCETRTRETDGGPQLGRQHRPSGLGVMVVMMVMVMVMVMMVQKQYRQ